MFYPKLSVPDRVWTGIDISGGCVPASGTAEGSFRDMKNISSDAFPRLITRPPRARWHGAGEDGTVYLEGVGLTAAANVNGSLCFSSGGKVYAEGGEIEGAELDADTDTRSLVPFGRNFFVSPEGLYFVKRSSGGYDIKRSRNSFFSSETPVAFGYVLPEGAAGEPTYFFDLPESASDGEKGIAETENGMELMVFSSESGTWSSAGRVFISLESDGIDRGFSVGDEVSITGGRHAGLNTALSGQGHEISSLSDGRLVVSGVLRNALSATGVSVEKRMPCLDFAVEHGNRIWGCRYGIDENGDFVNAVYASALGKPTVWYRLDGSPDASFAAGLGCAGEFTGACAVGNGVVFFKEEYIIKVTGGSPSDFSVSCLPARGVQKGCSRSCVNMNERVFYKSPTGVMVYDGAYPYKISEESGSKKYGAAAAGAIDGKYYIAMTDSDGERSIFVYDTSSSLWHREDDAEPTRAFVAMDGCLYSVCERETRPAAGTLQRIYVFKIHDFNLTPAARNILGGGETAAYTYEKEEAVSWFAETPFLSFPKAGNDEFLRKLVITLRLAEGSVLSVSVKADKDGTWRRVCFVDTPKNGSFSVPMNMPACRCFALKFEGRGECEISSVVCCREKAGEVRGIV